MSGFFFVIQSLTFVLMCFLTSSREPLPLYSGKATLSTFAFFSSAK